jgi:hypothetical protein
MPKKCELCGETSPLRPYGPKGEWICYECGMKNIETTTRAFMKTLEASDPLLGAFLTLIPEPEKDRFAKEFIYMMNTPEDPRRN